MMLTCAPALLPARENASSNSQHPQSWSASKPFTRVSLPEMRVSPREILGRLQSLLGRAPTDETLTDHDTQCNSRQSARQSGGPDAEAATPRAHGLSTLPSGSRRDGDACP